MVSCMFEKLSPYLKDFYNGELSEDELTILVETALGCKVISATINDYGDVVVHLIREGKEYLMWGYNANGKLLFDIYEKISTMEVKL